MNLVDEEHVAGIEVGEQAGQVARLVEHGARCSLELRTHLVGDDVRQRGLAQSRRAVQQHMVQRVAPHEGGLDEDAQVFDDLLLPGEVLQLLRSDLIFEFEIALDIA